MSQSPPSPPQQQQQQQPCSRPRRAAALQKLHEQAAAAAAAAAAPTRKSTRKPPPAPVQKAPVSNKKPPTKAKPKPSKHLKPFSQRTKKQQQQQTAAKKNKSRRLPSCLTCPRTGEPVWIVQATLTDITTAQRRRRHPYASTSAKRRHYLVQVASSAQRQAVYQQAAQALQQWEEALLPDYGRLSWKVHVKVTDPPTTVVSSTKPQRKTKTKTTATKYKPFFVFTKTGQLELAAWPHIIDKIPTPPKFPGFQSQTKCHQGNKKKKKKKQAKANSSSIIHPDDDIGMVSPLEPVQQQPQATAESDSDNDSDDDSDDEPLAAVLTREQEQIQSLQERPATGVSELAYSEKWRVPLPHITMKWSSPLQDQTFYSRKSAWDYALRLARQEVVMDKVLRGIGARGQEIAAQNTLTRKAVLQAGKWRFERDGLWVVGQEEEWLSQRIMAKQRVQEEKNVFLDQQQQQQQQLRGSGLAYYLQCHRKEHQQRRLAELRHQQRPIQRQQQQPRGPGSMVMDLVNDSSVVAQSARSLFQQPVQQNNADTTSKEMAMMDVPIAAAVEKADRKEDAIGTNLPMAAPAAAGVVDSEEDTAMAAVVEDHNIVASKDTTTYVQMTDVGNSSISSKRVTMTHVQMAGAKDNGFIKTATVSGQTCVSEALLKAHNRNEMELEEANKTDSAMDVVESETTQEATNEKQYPIVQSKVTEKVSFTLRDAESELRVMWKTLSDDERRDWTERAKVVHNSLSEQIGPITECSSAANAGALNGTGWVTPPASDSTLDSEALPLPSADASSAAIQETRDLAQPQAHHHQQQTQVESSSTRAIISPSPTTSTSPTTTPCKRKADIRTPVASPKQRNSMLKPGPSSKWCMNEEQIKLCYDAAVSHFDEVMRTVKARDLTRELQDGFDLLRERGRGRYDMELPVFDTPTFSFLTDTNKAPWMPVVKEILGDDVVLIHKGVFLSLPDAETQCYHQDGVHLTTQYQRPCHAINVFIPLVDLSGQGTEFCLGSHILGNEDFDRDFAETPSVKKGTPICFDYRLGHRGRKNSSQSIRPVVYCTYARGADGKEFRDSVNFSRKRYHRIGDLVNKAPTREERARMREQAMEAQAVEECIAASLEGRK